MSGSIPESEEQQSPQRATSVAPSLGELFVTFLRLGATAFGGPAMVVYIKQLVVDRKRWLNVDTFDDGVALCQTLPGATAMQAAAYVGLNVRGVGGAAVSYLGFGLPAFGLMLGFTILYAHTHNLPGVVSAFSGLQTIVVGILANAAVTFGWTTLRHWRRGMIALLAVGLFGWGINPFIVVVSAVFAGFCILKEEAAAAPSKTPDTAMPQTTKPLLIIASATAAILTSLFFANRPLYEMAITMVRIDLFAFGGGFASVPLLFNEAVKMHHWLDGSTLMDGIVLGQATPGPIVITATFVGYLTHGILGSIVATLGIFMPSFLIVIAITPHFNRLRNSPFAANLIAGALCSFPGLLLIVTLHFAQSVRWDIARLLLAIAAFVALRLGVNIFWVVLAGASLSMLVCR